MDIFLQLNDIKEGPFSPEQVKDRLDSGSIAKTSLAWHEGLSNWMPVMAVLTPRAKPPTFSEPANPASAKSDPAVQINAQEAVSNSSAKPEPVEKSDSV